MHQTGQRAGFGLEPAHELSAFLAARHVRAMQECLAAACPDRGRDLLGGAIVA
jgi:hypothetical protein